MVVHAVLAAAVCLAGGTAADEAHSGEWTRESAPELATLLEHGLIADGSIFASWALGEVTVRGGTLEIILLRRTDGGPLSTLVRRTGHTDTSGPFAVESAWRGGPPEPHDVGFAVSWLHRWVERHSEPVDAVLVRSAGSSRTNNGDGGHAPPRGRRRTHLPGPDRLHGLLVKLAAIVALISGVVVVLRRRAFDSTLLATGSALAVAAFTPRWWIATHGVIHENHHGYRYLESVISGRASAFGDILFAYPAVIGPLSRLLGGADEAVFGLNAALGAWSAVALAALVRRWTGSGWSGFLAGAIWALAPYPIRLGPTEVFANFSTATLLTAAVALVYALDRVGRSGLRASVPELVLAVSLTSLAGMSRVLTLAHPAAVFGLALACGAIRSRRQWVTAAGGAAAVALWIAPLAHEVLLASRSSSVTLGPHILLRDIRHGALVLLDPTAVPLSILILAGVGAVVMIARRSWRRAGEGAVGVLACALVVAVGALPYGMFISRSRTELAGTALAMGLAGIGAGRLGNGSQKGRRTVLRAIGAALALSTVSSWALLSRPFLGTLEYRYIADEVLPAMRRVQPPLGLLRPDTGPLVEPIQASWWRRQVPGLTLRRIDPGDPTSAATHGETTGAVFLLTGLECFWLPGTPAFDPGSDPPELGNGRGFAADPDGPPMHPACAALLREGDWRAVGEHLVLDRRAAAGSWAPLPADDSRIQLYRRDVR